LENLQFVYKSIGLIKTPFSEPEGVPIQPSAGRDIEGVIELFDEYVECLKDLEGFSHIILIYHFHKVRKNWRPRVTPYLSKSEKGLFATRAPSRPNCIGLSVVHVKKIEANRIFFNGVDIVNNTPLLDIKPFIPAFQYVEDPIKIGWLEKGVKKLEIAKDDGRFKY